MARQKVLSLVLGLVITLGACGGDNAKTTDDDGGGANAGNATQHDGGAGGEAMIVDGLDVPLPSGATVLSDTTIEPARAVLAAVPNDQFDATVAFYDDFVANQTPTWDTITADAGGKSWQGILGSDFYLILASVPIGTDDDVLISVTVTPAEE